MDLKISYDDVIYIMLISFDQRNQSIAISTEKWMNHKGDNTEK